jgi:S-adenosylmethionine decarboxylase
MRRRLAPEIFRKRLLIEGFFARPDVGAQVIINYLRYITSQLGLRTYAEPIVHQTGGQGKDANEGFDAFVPLIDSGIYVCVWSRPRFLSIILYTCAEFDEKKAEAFTAEFFEVAETDSFLF